MRERGENPQNRTFGDKMRKYIQKWVCFRCFFVPGDVRIDENRKYNSIFAKKYCFFMLSRAIIL